MATVRGVFWLFPILAIGTFTVACSGDSSADSEPPTNSAPLVAAEVESHALTTTSGIQQLMVTVKNTGAVPLAGLVVNVGFWKDTTAVYQTVGVSSMEIANGQSVVIQSMALPSDMPSHDCYRISVSGYERNGTQMRTLVDGKGTCP